MSITPLPFRSIVQQYEKQAADTLESWRAGDPDAIQLFRENHPRFLDDRIHWLPRNLSDSEIRGVTLDLADAQLAVARWYSFQSWPRLVEWVEAVAREDSQISKFESAVEAVIAGEVAIVQALLNAGEDPNRYNPKGNHGHSTPLHQAALSGHDAVVRLLVERGARLDIKDTIYDSTPLGWAEHGGQTEIAEYLRTRAAKSEA